MSHLYGILLVMTNPFVKDFSHPPRLPILAMVLHLRLHHLVQRQVRLRKPRKSVGCEWRSNGWPWKTVICWSVTKLWMLNCETSNQFKKVVLTMKPLSNQSNFRKKPNANAWNDFANGKLMGTPASCFSQVFSIVPSIWPITNGMVGCQIPKVFLMHQFYNSNQHWLRVVPYIYSWKNHSVRILDVHWATTYKLFKWLRAPTNWYLNLFQFSFSVWIGGAFHCPLRTLQVPESIHEAWRKGGDSRNALLKALAEANFNKEPFQVFMCATFGKSVVGQLFRPGTPVTFGAAKHV